MSGWYYSSGDNTFGPVDDAALKKLATNGKLTAESLVCHADKTKNEWVAVTRIAGLRSLLTEMPVDYVTATAIDECAMPANQAKKTLIKLIVVVGVVLGILLVAAAIYDERQRNSPEFKKAVAERALKEKTAKAEKEVSDLLEQRTAEERKRESEIEFFIRDDAKKVVRRVLKFPNDASFGWSQKVEKIGEGKFQVIGTVTAQNSFGAQFKKVYVVGYFESDKNEWSPSLVTLDDEVMLIDERAFKK